MAKPRLCTQRHKVSRPSHTQQNAFETSAAQHRQGNTRPTQDQWVPLPGAPTLRQMGHKRKAQTMHKKRKVARVPLGRPDRQTLRSQGHPSKKAPTLFDGTDCIRKRRKIIEKMRTVGRPFVIKYRCCNLGASSKTPRNWEVGQYCSKNSKSLRYIFAPRGAKAPEMQ